VTPKVTAGVFAIPVDSAESSTPYVKAADQVIVNVTQGVATHTITVPTGVSMASSGGGDFSTADLVAAYVEPAALSGFRTGTIVRAGLHWGLTGATLEASSPITVRLYVGPGLEGLSLDILRSVTGNSGWTTDGINTISATVSGGYVTFEASKTSYYAAITYHGNIPDKYTVTASVSGGHGTVSPATQTVNGAGTATITITADSGYHTASVRDNGAAVTPTPTTAYAIHNMAADHTVVVTFAFNGSTFYFAEGYTGPNFQEYLTLGNPNTKAATADVTYMFPNGTTQGESYSVPATGRTTVNVNSAMGPNLEVSIEVVSDTPNLVAERPMYFNYNGVWTGGSDAIGAVAPNTKWYFAEGNTLPEFDQYVTVLNPGSTKADLTFHYMVEGSGEKDVTGSVGAHSRATFKTRDQIGSNKNESLYLSSNRGVVAERPMYFNYQGLASDNWTGGHDVVGTNSPNTDWYFAEGTTRNNSTDGAFEQWLTLQNPTTSPITVSATYQLAAGQGSPIQKSYTVPKQQRLTVSVNREIGQDKDCSVHLNSNTAFIAERPMYFNYHNVWTGGHDVLGANGSAKTWFFAEGTTRTNFEEWLCLQNPGNSDANTTVTYYTTSGQAINKSWTVKANTRLTVNVNQDAGANQDISARVSSDQPIIVERPMYFNYNGWDGGHDVVGYVPQ